VSGETPSRRLPGAFSQFWVIFERRWRLFFREKSQVVLQLSLLFVFPCLVVLFAYQGLPQIQNPEMMLRRDVVKELQEMVQFTIQSSQVGGLVSGLIMFQVILLTLMGSNNSAREVVAERLIFEKEKLAGLRPASYVMAKVAFLAILVAAQSAWMCIFVKVICGFPGDILLQLIFLFLANAAVTSICLGVSCWARTTEQASLISIYLVGFQLPLSGVILALPEPLGALVRPTIAAYWSWSGMLQTMKDTRFYDLVVSITLTPVSTISQSLLVLVAQVVLGLALAFAGASRRRWE
jgi:hypothetical protein